MSEVSNKRFSGRIRDAAKRLKTFTAGDLADAAGVMTLTERKNVSAYIREFVGRGEMARVNADGPSRRSVGTQPCEEQYRYVLKATRITNRQRLWDVIRRMDTPAFELADLVQITGIRYGQVKRFCRWLHDERWAERVSPGRYRRVKGFGVDVPADKHESNRTIAMRDARRAEALAALDNAATAIERAKRILAE